MTKMKIFQKLQWEKLKILIKKSNSAFDFYFAESP